MIYEKEFGKMFALEQSGISTRSPKIIDSLHETIANQVKSKGFLVKREYKFQGLFGSKKVDIAVLDEEKNIIGAIMFKGIRSEYNKNANNYFEQSRGENCLFIESGIPVYQIIFIPTQVRHKDSKGNKVFEVPTKESYSNYCNYLKKYVPNYVKYGVYYFDVNYENNTAKYSNKVVPNVEETVTEGINNFLEGLV